MRSRADRPGSGCRLFDEAFRASTLRPRSKRMREIPSMQLRNHWGTSTCAFVPMRIGTIMTSEIPRRKQTGWERRKIGVLSSDDPITGSDCEAVQIPDVSPWASEASASEDSHLTSHCMNPRQKSNLSCS